MDISEAIDKRRTIRKYKSPATEEQVLQIITEGVKAPSAGNRQTWEFVLVDDQDLIEKISEIKYALNRGKPRGQEVSPEMEKVGLTQKNSFANASLVVIYYHKRAGMGAADAWLAIENMSLYAVSLGLGTRIAGFWGEGITEVNKLMKAPEDMVLVGALSIGVPDEEPGARSLRPNKDWLHRNSF